jgi:hypothetical protein
VSSGSCTTSRPCPCRHGDPGPKTATAPRLRGCRSCGRGRPNSSCTRRPPGPARRRPVRLLSPRLGDQWLRTVVVILITGTPGHYTDDDVSTCRCRHCRRCLGPHARIHRRAVTAGRRLMNRRNRGRAGRSSATIWSATSLRIGGAWGAFVVPRAQGQHRVRALAETMRVAGRRVDRDDCSRRSATCRSVPGFLRRSRLVGIEVEWSLSS